jgi:hypothetical protein
MESCIERGAALAGLVEGEARVGAVGLLDAMSDKGPALVGAIFTGERWAVLTESGVLSIRTKPRRAWNLP